MPLFPSVHEEQCSKNIGNSTDQNKEYTVCLLRMRPVRPIENAAKPYHVSIASFRVNKIEAVDEYDSDEYVSVNRKQHMLCVKEHDRKQNGQGYRNCPDDSGQKRGSTGTVAIRITE